MKRTIFFLLAILLLLSGCKDKKEDVKEETQTNNTEKVTENKIVLKELTIETGSKVPTIEEFLQEGTIKEFSDLRFENTDPDCVEDKKTECSVMIKGKNLAATGEYKVIVTINGDEYTTKLIVKDTTAPEVKTKDVTLTEGDKIDITSFIDTCTDNSNAKCSYKLVNNENKEVNLKNLKKGEHKLTIVVNDQSNNETKKEVKLVIKEKKKEPSNNKPSNNNQTKPSTSNPTPQPKPTPTPEPEPEVEKPLTGTKPIDRNVKKLTYEFRNNVPDMIPFKSPGYNGEYWYIFENPIVTDKYGTGAYMNWHTKDQTRAQQAAAEMAKKHFGENSNYCVQYYEIFYTKNKDSDVIGIGLKTVVGKYDEFGGCYADTITLYNNNRTTLYQNNDINNFAVR